MIIRETCHSALSTKGASSKDVTAMAPQSTLSIPEASQTPHFSDSEYLFPVDYFLGGERTMSPPPVALEKAMVPVLSTADDVSDRANSISSVNSYSSINAAYGTLGLDSPGSGQSSRLMSSSPQSPIPDMHQVDIPRAMSSHDIIRQRAAKHRGTSGVGKVQGLYICDCCPKKPKKFNTREELG